MKKRLFLLPGFAEDAFCFNELKPYLKNYEIIDINYRPILNQFIFPIITRENFAKKIIKYYNILPSDKLIGHSMGGYFSFQIREIQGNEICMIASFNDTDKIIDFIPKFPRFSQLIAFTGFIKTKMAHNILLKKIKEENYRKIMQAVFLNMKSFTNIQLSLMMEMCYDEKIESKLPNPLRIHDIKDRVISAPTENYIQVNGGHFCLNLYAAETALAMENFLK